MQVGGVKLYFEQNHAVRIMTMIKMLGTLNLFFCLGPVKFKFFLTCCCACHWLNLPPLDSNFDYTYRNKFIWLAVSVQYVCMVKDNDVIYMIKFIICLQTTQDTNIISSDYPVWFVFSSCSDDQNSFWVSDKNIKNALSLNQSVIIFCIASD